MKIAAPIQSMILIGIMMAGTACKDKTAAPKPAQKAAGGAEGLQTGDATAGGGTADDLLTEQLSVELDDASEDFKYSPGNSITIKFNILGVPSGGVVVGLAETPSGGVLKKSGSVVSFIWSSAEKGSHKFKFLLRDKSACEAALSVSKCKIDESDFGDISSTEFDTTSDTYTLEVGDSSTDSTASDTSNSSSGGNSQLISQITSLLGGGGGGGITQLLQGLGGGQLQQLLGMLQGGGGGLDIAQLLPLLQGGIPLKGDEKPVVPAATKP